MSVNYIEIDTGRLKQDMDILRSCVDCSGQCLKDISDIVMELDGQWEGAANSMFNQRILEEIEFLKEMIKEAADLLGCLGYADKEYVECENFVADIIAAVRI